MGTDLGLSEPPGGRFAFETGIYRYLQVSRSGGSREAVDNRSGGSMETLQNVTVNNGCNRNVTVGNRRP